MGLERGLSQKPREELAEAGGAGSRLGSPSGLRPTLRVCQVGTAWARSPGPAQAFRVSDPSCSAWNHIPRPPALRRPDPQPPPGPARPHSQGTARPGRARSRETQPSDHSSALCLDSRRRGLKGLGVGPALPHLSPSVQWTRRTPPRGLRMAVPSVQLARPGPEFLRPQISAQTSPSQTSPLVVRVPGSRLWWGRGPEAPEKPPPTALVACAQPPRMGRTPCLSFPSRRAACAWAPGAGDSELPHAPASVRSSRVRGRGQGRAPLLCAPLAGCPARGPGLPLRAAVGGAGGRSAEGSRASPRPPGSGRAPQPLSASAAERASARTASPPASSLHLAAAGARSRAGPREGTGPPGAHSRVRAQRGSRAPPRPPTPGAHSGGRAQKGHGAAGAHSGAQDRRRRHRVTRRTAGSGPQQGCGAARGEPRGHHHDRWGLIPASAHLGLAKSHSLSLQGWETESRRGPAPPPPRGSHRKSDEF